MTLLTKLEKLIFGEMYFKVTFVWPLNNLQVHHPRFLLLEIYSRGKESAL